MKIPVFKCQALWQSIRGNLGKLLSVLVPTFTATIIAIFTPLQDIIVNLIWKESAEIKLSADRDTLDIEQAVRITLKISPKSKANIAPGIVQIQYDPLRLFTPQTIQLQQETPEIKAAKILFNEASSLLNFRAIEDGSTQIIASLKTRNNFNYSDTLNLFIKKNSPATASSQSIAAQIESARNRLKNTKPTVSNYNRYCAGIWRFELGSRSGELLITDAYQGQKQSGFFLLNSTPNSQDSGVIANFLRDGQVFNLTLLFKESPNSWQISAKWKRNEGYVEVQGRAYLRKNIDLNSLLDSADFYATIPIRE